MVSMYKGNVKRHERKNCPKFRSCQLCKWFETDTVTVYNRNHGGDPGSTDYDLPVWLCNAPEKAQDGESIELDYKRNNCPDFKPRAEEQSA
jgi:hypothetical protein